MANKQFYSSCRVAQDTSGQRKRKRRGICGVILALLVCFAIGNVYGRYVHGENNTGTVTAKTFYFTSDLLPAAEDTDKIYVLNAGTESISFKLHNYQDTLNISSTDVFYTVTVTGGPDGNPAVVSPASGVMEAKATPPNTDQTETITLSNLKDGYSYVVTVSGTSKADSGYLQVLDATFKVSEAEKKVYKHLDIDTDPHYVLLTVWTENVKGTVNIATVPAGLIPDQTDPILEGKAAGSSVNDTQNFNTVNASHVYRFFRETKNAPFNLNQFSDIKLTETGGGEPLYAVPGTP